MKQINKETRPIIIIQIFKDLEKNNSTQCDEKDCLLKKYGCRGPKTEHCFTPCKND